MVIFVALFRAMTLEFGAKTELAECLPATKVKAGMLLGIIDFVISNTYIQSTR